MLRLLEKIEARIVPPHHAATMDALLAFLKYALAHGNRVLGCKSCCRRSEYLTLLAIFGDRIAGLADRIATAFFERVHEQERREDERQQASAESGSGCRLGEYEVETPKEWTCMLAAMIKLQLNGAMDYVRRMKLMAVSIGLTVQVQALEQVEQRLKNLLLRMQRVVNDAEGKQE